MLRLTGVRGRALRWGAVLVGVTLAAGAAGGPAAIAQRNPGGPALAPAVPAAGVDPSGVDTSGLDPSGLDPSGLDPSGLDPSGGAAAGPTGKVSARLAGAEGRTTAFVQLAKRPAVDAFDAERAAGKDRAGARRAAGAAQREVRDAATEVLADLRAGDSTADLLAVTTNAVPGLIVHADAARIRDLAGRTDVASVRTVAGYARSSTSSVQLTRALSAWQRTGRTGAGIRIGVVDDGIDYTHAAFGGPGTRAAYRSVDPVTVDPATFPTAKVVGGTDLVGDDYDASGATGSPVPNPDPNPISCGHHGTHGASILGGLGVDADGSTFTGDYAKLTPEAVDAMRVGPGMAPEAVLYAIKVFGCSGLTSTMVTKAMDLALDPNSDGDFGDRLHLLNLALDSEYHPADDPTSLFVRKIAAHGVLSVFSAGNGGDLYDVGASPGSAAPEALTVASTRDAYVLRDAIQVTGPAGLTGPRTGQFNLAYLPVIDDLDLRGRVVPLPAGNADGCAPYPAAEAAQVAGRIVWLEWDDDAVLNARQCGSVRRANNARDAGATGVLLSSTVEHFPARVTGNVDVPMFELTGSSTAALRPALRAGTLEVWLRGQDRGNTRTHDPAIEDTLSDFTSRGIRSPAVKPDIGAPGDTIAAAWNGSGNQRAVYSGTSMSAPHVTGISALVREAHPDWSVEEVKAALMNTAGHDVTNGSGTVFAPQRVGAGRVDAKAALDTRVVAYVEHAAGAVSASFGVVEAGRPVTLSRTLKVVNKGSTSAEFRVGYQGLVDTPGVRFQLSRSSVRLSPGGVARVRLTLRIDDPRALRKTLDPTMQAVQGGQARQFLAEVAGRVVLTPRRAGLLPLRVPVAAWPKPVAAVTTPDTVRFGNGRTEATLRLGGRGVRQGSGSQAYRSLVSLVELHGRSARLPRCGAGVTGACTVNGTATGGDLRYVGATSTAPLAAAAGRAEEALLAFGLATWGNWANIGSHTVPFVRIDSTGDGVADFETRVVRAARSDVLLARTVDLHRPLPAGGFTTVDTQAVNGQLGDVDTGVFDTNVVVLPVRVAALGIDPAAASHPVRYTVGVSGFYPAPGSAVVDSIDTPMSFDPLAPSYWVSGAGGPALSYQAQPGTALIAHRRVRPVPAGRAGPPGLLALHHHNGSGTRAEVIRIR